MKAIKVNSRAAQGDVLLLRIDKLPEDAIRDKSDGAGVIAHSETGHHHVAIGCDVYRALGEPSICYLVSEDSIEIEHRRPWDTHAPLILEGGGVWIAKRQREHTPDGWRQVED